MPNNIQLFKNYIDLLDTVYKQASLTAILDSDTSLLQMTANGKEFLIPKMEMDGLGEYSRTNGYPTGSVTLEFETKAPNFDRARMFQVDKMDDIETAKIAFGRLASEFIRTKAVPEIDATRFATYCAKGTPVVSAALATGEAWIKAVSDAVAKMDEAEVPSEGRILYITPTGLRAIQDLDTTKSREVLTSFAAIVKVPQARFYTAIKSLSGKTGEEKGGFEKATTGKELNFQIVHPSALMQVAKDIVNKIIDPETNQDGDWWKFFFHLYGINEVYENKKSGIYSHSKA